MPSLSTDDIMLIGKLSSLPVITFNYLDLLRLLEAYADARDEMDADHEDLAEAAMALVSTMVRLIDRYREP